jgi:hypothetical protein
MLDYNYANSWAVERPRLYSVLVSEVKLLLMPATIGGVTPPGPEAMVPEAEMQSGAMCCMIPG